MRAPIDGSVTLVTGASSGIGLEIAKQLAPRVRALVLLARREERLAALRAELLAAHPKLTVLVKPCDVTDRAAVDAVLAAVESEVGPIDILINNAGMGDFGVYDKASWDKTQRMIDLNITALAYLTRRLAPPMVERGRGGILNISSGFGLQFLPGFAAYAATKHFVTAFTEALRLDLRGTGVVVSQVCPGPVTTEFESLTVDFEAPKVPGFVAISAERCARAAISGFSRGRAMVIPGVIIWLLLLLGAVTPRFLLRWVYAPIAGTMRRMEAAARAKA